MKTILNNDIFARLSQSALKDMLEAEELMTTSLAEYERSGSKVDKYILDTLGDDLLDKYMNILGRPGSFISRAYCALAEQKERTWT